MSTDTGTVNITVNAVNDAPSFTKGADQTVLEDSGAQTVSGWATGISAGPADESGQTVSFTITNNTNAALFSVAPAVASNGTLTYTPAANAYGTATITLKAVDNGAPPAESATQTFNITVTGGQRCAELHEGRRPDRRSRTPARRPSAVGRRASAPARRTSPDRR